jgi:hypothetical protein
LRRQIDLGGDPLIKRYEEKIAQAPACTERGDLEEQITAKTRAFLDQGIEPIGYLYRHYHPNGDLLYVGMSIEPIRRQKAHTKNAKWRAMICRLLIEPCNEQEPSRESWQ